MTRFYFEQEGAVVSVRLVTNEAVNAWQGTVLLPERLKVERIITTGTFSEIWQTPPRRDEAGLVFLGGKTNGFSGDGLLFKFIAEPGRYLLRFSPETSAYLNDGSGTAVPTTLATFVIKPAVSVEMPADTVRPQSFQVAILGDERFFDGRPVAVFGTEDLESGVSYYQVREWTTAGKSDWHLAESPYLIQPDVRRLEVKAVDNSGNERVESLRVGGFGWNITLAVVFIIAVLAAFLAYNKRKKWRAPLSS